MLNKRRVLRLKDYDYSEPGAYFVTICTQNRKHLFGEIANGEMRLNEFGKIVQGCWDDLPNHYGRINLDAFVIMPNHTHGIIWILDGYGNVGAGFKPAPTPATRNRNHRHGIPEIVRAFKTFASRRVNESRTTPGVAVWQRNYYEHVIRNDEELFQTRQYIQENPLQWDLDPENPNCEPAVLVSK